MCWFQLDIDNVTRMTVTATLNSTQYFPEDSVPIEKSSQEKIENQHNTVFDNKKENENLSNKSCRVYVGNLAWKVQWRHLKDHMRSLGGNVIRADVFVDSQGRSRGCGIVEYSTPEEAQDAKENLNDSELFDRKIFVREDREENPDFRGRSPHTMNAGRRRSWTNNRPTLQNNRSASDYRNHRPGKQPSRFQKNFASTRAFNQEKDMNCLVFVGNLPWSTSWQDIKDLFRECGEVVRVEIHAEKGVSCGCGTVLFKTQEEAQNAIAHFNNYELDGQEMLVRLYDHSS